MKKYLVPLLSGIIVSYCFASMVLNQRIVNPVMALQNRAAVLSWSELSAGMKDFESVSGNRLRSTTNDPWIEIQNIRERAGRLRSVTYKVKPVGEDDEIKTQLCYADTEQGYTEVRSLTAVFGGDATVIEIPDYAGPIDKLRLDLTSRNDVTLEIEEISLNMNTRFSAPLMAFIYALWCLAVFLGAGKQPEPVVELSAEKVALKA